MYYIIKFQDGSYVKTGRYDTFKIDDAKKFDTEFQAEQFIRKNCTSGAVVICING